MTKIKKTREELQRMVMDSVRTHPTLSTIRSVAIIDKSRAQPYQPNWDAAFVRDSPSAADPEGIGARIVTELQNQFDLQSL